MFLHIFTILKFPSLLVASTHKKEEIKSNKNDGINILEMLSTRNEIPTPHITKFTKVNSCVNENKDESLMNQGYLINTVHNQLTNPKLPKFNNEIISGKYNDEHVYKTFLIFRNPKNDDLSQERSSKDYDERLEKINSIVSKSSIKQQENIEIHNNNFISNNIKIEMNQERRIGSCSQKKVDINTNGEKCQEQPSKGYDQSLKEIFSSISELNIKEKEKIEITNNNPVSFNFVGRMNLEKRIGKYYQKKDDVNSNYDKYVKKDYIYSYKNMLREKLGRNKRRFVFQKKCKKQIINKKITTMNDDEFVNNVLKKINNIKISTVNDNLVQNNQILVKNKDNMTVKSDLDKNMLLLNFKEKCKTLLEKKIYAVIGPKKSDKTSKFSSLFFVNAVDSCFDDIWADIEMLEKNFSMVVISRDVFEELKKYYYRPFAELYYKNEENNKEEISNTIPIYDSNVNVDKEYKKYMVFIETKSQEKFFLKDIKNNKYGIFTGIFLEFLIESIKEALSENMKDTSQ